MARIIVNKGDSFVLRGKFGGILIEGYGAINKLSNKRWEALMAEHSDYLNKLKSDGFIEFATGDTDKTIDEDAKADNIKDALDAQAKRDGEISNDPVSEAIDIPNVNDNDLYLSNEDTEAENDGSVPSTGNDTDTRNQDATTDESSVETATDTSDTANELQ